MVDRATVAAARDDVDVFARELVGQPLWPHQAELARSPARIRCVVAGRQSGKSRTLALLALWTAFATPGARVLILSAGEDAARVLLSEIAALLASPLLAGAAVEENRSRIVLSTGSEVVSVPASTRQVRGRAVDLLVLDEASFMAPELWTAASFTVVARPGSRVVMASTPWAQDHFFAHAYRRGQTPDGEYASFHWPSTVSPLVDTALLESFRGTMTAREYAREVEAEWVDETGAYFTPAELDAATVDYELIPPERARGQVAAAGVDWAMARDADAITLVAPVDDGWLNAARMRDEVVYFVPWLEHHYRMGYAAFVDRICEIGDGYRLEVTISESNGVGAMPSEVLRERMHQAHRGRVFPAWTDLRRKQAAFGAVKVLLSQGRLVLPREPELRKQLGCLEFEQTPGGSVRIAVPTLAGHDDIAMSLALAMSAIEPIRRRRERFTTAGTGEVLECGNGTRIPGVPRCWDLGLAPFTVRDPERADAW